MRRAVILGAVVITIAGCGSDPKAEEPAAQRAPAATPTRTPPPTDAWAEQVTAVCVRHTDRLEQRLADVDRALLHPRGGPLPRTVKRYSAAVDALFEDIKDVKRPDDGSANRFISQYAYLVSRLAIAEDTFEWSRNSAIVHIADANTVGAKAHYLAKQLGAEACTGWLVGA
jgi:hypothetical protein